MAVSPRFLKPSSRHQLAMLLASSSPSPPPLSLPSLRYRLEASPMGDTLRRRGSCSLEMLLGADDGNDNVDSRCRYPSKRCRNARVRKASGALHRYCAFHRSKANANQKRWVDRQRETDASPSPSSSTSVWSEASSSPTSSSASPTQTSYRWVITSNLDSRPLSPSTEKLKRTRQPTDDERTVEEAFATADAATLSDDDWDDLLSLLAPTRAAELKDSSVRPTKRSRRDL
jgi:hypothetical protein